jgi:hypothetical protein
MAPEKREANRDARRDASRPEKRQGSGGFKTSPGRAFGRLEQVFDDVWWAWGTVRFLPGFLFPRNMVIVKDKGELVVVHPVLMPEEEQTKVEALGKIAHVVRLGAFHGMDDAAYVKRYGAKLWAPPEVDVAEGLILDHELRPGGELPLTDARLFTFEASKTPETVLHLERHGGMLLTCDSIQNWETTTGCSLLGAVMSRMMGFRGRACLGPGWRKMCEPKDGVGFKPAFEQLLDLELRHILSAHGAPMKDTAKDALRESVRRAYGS